MKDTFRRVFPADRRAIRDGLCLGAVVTAILWFPVPQLLNRLLRRLLDGMNRSQREAFGAVAILIFVLLIGYLILANKKQKKEGQEKKKSAFDVRTGWYSLPFLIVGVPLLLFGQTIPRRYGIGCLFTGLLILAIRVASVKKAERP